MCPRFSPPPARRREWARSDLLRIKSILVGQLLAMRALDLLVLAFARIDFYLATYETPATDSFFQNSRVVEV